jgi:hypothetical protein
LKVFTAPEVPNGHLTNTLFLAGSIEMGKAADWQQLVIDELQRTDIAGVIYNPRRTDWDPTWEAGSPEMKAQINWELDQLEDAQTIFFYFQGDTLSPISLLELGLAVAWSVQVGPRPNVIVVCERNFWRRTNIIETCRRGLVRRFDNLEDGVRALKQELEDF